MLVSFEPVEDLNSDSFVSIDNQFWLLLHQGFIKFQWSYLEDFHIIKILTYFKLQVSGRLLLWGPWCKVPNSLSNILGKLSVSNAGSSPNFASNIKGATKLYFMHYSCVVIILFNADLYMSVFPTYSVKNLVFVILCSIYFVSSALNTISFLQTYNICLINVYVTKCSVILFSHIKCL